MIFRYPFLRLQRFLDGKKWMPVIFLLLTRVNTNDMLLLAVLHNVRVRTDRKVIVITAWPFWPQETSKDVFYRSFFQGLTSDLTYVWIPGWLHRLIKMCAIPIMRIFQIADLLIGPMELNSTFRYSDSSTIFQTDILVQDDKAVLRIPKSHEHVMEDRLRDLGVGTGRWFVCVHARANGWTGYTRAYGQKQPPNYQIESDEYRNVDIETYFPAIEYITSMGGIVIRMGDPTMEPVNGIDGLIDYPFTQHRSLPMDLYLVARSQFVIGCDAGFTTNFPVAFGTPTLVTNVASPVITAYWPYENTRVMLKPTVETDSGRVLSLLESSHPRLSTTHNAVVLNDMGYRWEPNTAEEILDATKEMVELVESGSFGHPMTDEQEYFHRRRNEAVRSMLTPDQPFFNCKWSGLQNSRSRISASYASKHFRSEASQAPPP